MAALLILLRAANSVSGRLDVSPPEYIYETHLPSSVDAFKTSTSAVVDKVEFAQLKGSNIMKIGIIGAGNIGAALAQRFRDVDHEVTIANSRGPASLANLAQDTGARAGTVWEAVAGNDVVVVTIPLNKVPALPAGLFAAASEDLIVIDTCNYYPRERDGRVDEIEAGLTESAWVARCIKHPVIKVFNSIGAVQLLNNGKPKGAKGRIALPVGGNDQKAKAVVMDLVDQIKFDAVDAGTIEETWRQQPGSPSYGGDLDVARLRQALAGARSERTPDFSGTANSPGTFASPA